MAVSIACYVTREELKGALDFKETARNTFQLDRAIQGATTDVDTLLNRTFLPYTATKTFDWPNSQRARPWRLWLDQSEVADIVTTVPVVKSGGVVIPAAQVLWGPPNAGPPFTYLELDRSTSAAFGHGSTPQRDISIAGTFGYWLAQVAAGTLNGAINASVASLAVSNSALMGVGDQLVIGTERVTVTDRSYTDTGQAFTALAADPAARSLTVASGPAFGVGEVLQLDAERVLVYDITGNVLTFQRAWDGTVLAAHTSGNIFAPRQLAVIRAAAGSTAASHSNGDAIFRSLIPATVKELATAEASNNILQETSGYSRTVGSGDNEQPISGAGLADVRARAVAGFGRKARQRVI